MAVKSFLVNDDIYHDILSRQANGETFNPTEQAAIDKFMQTHQEAEVKLQQTYGIVRGNDGEMHKADGISREGTAANTAKPKMVMLDSGGRK